MYADTQKERLVRWISSIDDVLEHTKSDALHRKLSDCKDQHEQLQTQLQKQLIRFQDEGKNPSPIARVFPERTAPSQMIPSKDLRPGRFHQVIASICRLLNTISRCLFHSCHQEFIDT